MFENLLSKATTKQLEAMEVLTNPEHGLEYNLKLIEQILVLSDDKIDKFLNLMAINETAKP